MYRLHAPALFRFCQTFTSIRADEANDILQETFVRAFRSLDQLREGQKFFSWLLAIARNRCLSFLQREEKVEKKHLAWGDQTSPLLPPHPHEEEEEAQRQIALVREIIERFEPGPLKDCASAFYVEGLTTAEIAARYGLPKSTVTTRLDRFRDRIQKRLILRLLDS